MWLKFITHKKKLIQFYIKLINFNLKLIKSIYIQKALKIKINVIKMITIKINGT